MKRPVVQTFFNDLSNLEFKKCLNFIKKRSTQEFEKVENWLGNLTLCEIEYYRARFGIDTKVSLQKRYSFLSQQIAQQVKESPSESPDEDESTRHDYVNVKNLPRLVITRELWQSLINFLMIREKLCVLYESISTSSPPHKYDYFCKVIVEITQGTKKIGIFHQFLKRVAENINRELEILYKSLRCESYIDKLRYTECVFGFWNVKESFLKWRKMHPRPKRKKRTDLLGFSASQSFSPRLVRSKVNQSLHPNFKLHDVERSRTDDSISRLKALFGWGPKRDEKRDRFQSFIKPSKIKGKQSKMMGFEQSGGANARTKSLLEDSNLYKWLRMLHSATYSKFTLFFKNILQLYEPSVSRFREFLSEGALYISDIEQFSIRMAIHTVCILYSASRPKYTCVLDPHSGYSLQKNIDLDECLKKEFAGIKSYPLLYIHSPVLKHDKEKLMVEHWPNILNLIWTDMYKLVKLLKPLVFEDKSKKMCYFYLKVGEGTFMVVMKAIGNGGLGGRNKNAISEFMYKMNIGLQNLKLFHFLKSKSPH